MKMVVYLLVLREVGQRLECPEQIEEEIAGLRFFFVEREM